MQKIFIGRLNGAITGVDLHYGNPEFYMMRFGKEVKIEHEFTSLPIQLAKEILGMKVKNPMNKMVYLIHSNTEQGDYVFLAMYDFHGCMFVVKLD